MSKIADKFKSWVEKLENRILCQDGDSIILALSVTYLGIFNYKTRV